MTPVMRGGYRRTVVAGVLVCAAAATVAGCTSAGSSASSASAPAASTSAATTPAATSAAATSAPASPSASPSPTAAATSTAAAAAGPPACSTSGLKVTPGLSQGAAGSVYQVIDFTNISGVTCTIFGYPGVSLAGGTPVTQLGAAASRSTATAATLVTLAPGATGNALLRIVQAANYPASKCDPVSSTYLQIYPPNQTTPVYLGYQATACSLSSVNLLSVGVVQAGSGGGQ